MKPEEITTQLQDAADGLLFPSETDAPLTPFFWPSDDEKLTPQSVAELAHSPADAKIRTSKLDTFFKPAATEEDWHNDQEKAEVQRFQDLVQVLKQSLDNVKVYQIGDTNVDVYIAGKVEGGFAGLKTNVVET